MGRIDVTIVNLGILANILGGSNEIPGILDYPEFFIDLRSKWALEACSDAL